MNVHGSIITKYHGPTNTKGSRISAKSLTGKRLYTSYDHGLNATGNHRAAAEKLLEVMKGDARLKFDTDFNLALMDFGIDTGDTYAWPLK